MYVCVAGTDSPLIASCAYWESVYMMTGVSIGSDVMMSSRSSMRAWSSAVLFEPTVAPAAAGLSGTEFTGPYAFFAHVVWEKCL